MSEKRTKDRRGNGGDAPFAIVDRRPAFSESAEPLVRPRLPSMVEELQARAEEAERRAKEISIAYRAMEQEQDAFRERLQRGLDRRVDLARAELMRKMLGVLDDLQRAIDAASSPGEPPALLRGVALTRDHLLQVLASEGVERVETLGQPFDPAFAEAVETEVTTDPEIDGRVTAELAGGYALRGALLRPARVRVARRPAADRDGNGGAPDESQTR